MKNENLNKKQIDALKEFNKSNNEYIKKRNKKYIIIISLIITIILIIKIFFGSINIANIFGYSSRNARYYYVTVNNEQISVSYELRHRIPIIPYVINFDSHYLGNSYTNENYDIFYNAKDKKKYVIDIKSYSCFSKDNYQVECTNSTQTMKENYDTKYTKLKITHITNPYSIVYEGKYIKDITPYITKKGQYNIEITSNYSLVETKIYFYLEK